MPELKNSHTNRLTLDGENLEVQAKNCVAIYSRQDDFTLSQVETWETIEMQTAECQNHFSILETGELVISDFAGYLYIHAAARFEYSGPAKTVKHGIRVIKNGFEQPALRDGDTSAKSTSDIGIRRCAHPCYVEDGDVLAFQAWVDDLNMVITTDDMFDQRNSAGISLFVINEGEV